MNKENYLHTDTLPTYNCSNCKHFQKVQRKVLEVKKGDYYAVECNNFVHPLSDCVLRGFEGHSEQPGFSNTINDGKYIEKEKLSKCKDIK